MTKDIGPQVDALERSKEPKIFDVENRLTLGSDKIAAIKNWKNDVDYTFTVKATQLTSKVLKDGTIEAEFEIKSAKEK